jgi:hypothetical protein
MDISILNIFIWIGKLTFQFWILLFKFQKLISSKNWYLNFKLLFLNLLLSISIQKKIIEPKNRHFDFKYFDLNLEFDIWILKF